MKYKERRERSVSKGLAARTALTAGEGFDLNTITECFLIGNDKKNAGVSCGEVLNSVEDCVRSKLIT